jgi:Mrp family chromosome partitioning ATPase
MTSSSTHSTRLARLASRDGTLSYAQALALVKSARAQKLLPEILDDEGMQVALGIIKSMNAKSQVPPTTHTSASHLLLGHDHNAAPFLLNSGELSMHAMILGATGSGKSTTAKTLVAGMLEMGWSGVVLDLEDDAGPGGLHEFCTTYARTNSIAYQQVSIGPSPTTWLNPLEDLGPDEATDLLLSFYEFDDEYWSSINKKVLGQLVNLCYDAHSIEPSAAPYPSMFTIGSILEHGDLTAATKKLRAIVAASSADTNTDGYSALATPNPDTQKSSAGLGAKLTQLYDTVAGKRVLTGPGKSIDLTAPGLAYIGLDATGRPGLTRLAGSAILSRTSASAHSRLLSSEPSLRRFLVITSAAQTHYSHLSALISKARAGGICIVLFEQSPDDWATDDFNQLSQNINVNMVMAQSSANAAERCAHLIDEPTVTPAELRQLGVGEAVVRIDHPEVRVRWISISHYSSHLSHPVKSTTHGKVIVVASPIGGSGRTTLSYLLAAQLARRVKTQAQRVLLLDADINRPEVSQIVDYYSPNVSAVLDGTGGSLGFVAGINSERLAESILHRPDLGLDFLLGPAVPSEITKDMLDPKFYFQLIAKLYLDYDYVIVDTPVASTNHAMMRDAFLASADYTVVTTHLSMRAALGVDSWLRDIGVDDASANNSRIGLVINRADDPTTKPVGSSSFTVQEVTRELYRIPLAGVVPTSGVWQALPEQGRLADVISSLEPDVTTALDSILDRAVKAGRDS